MTAGRTAGDLVRDVSSLLTLPDVYLRISSLIDDPDTSAADIAKGISQDPAFTLRLLKVANSALYRFPSEVTTVGKAVSIIGTSQVRNLALSMSVAKCFAGLPNDLVSMA
ncbi:MAG TPA: HDOD domain-containing protein, partial [Rhodocyclaceae bacterium]